MSENDTGGQESDGEDEYECPVEECEYTNATKFGVSCHFGTHEDSVKEEIYLDELHRVADKVGHVPLRTDVEEHGRFSQATYEKFFETWNQALATAGYEPNKVQNIGREALLAEIRRLANDLGHPPTSDDMNEEGKFSVQPYKSEFGTWNTAVEESGFKPIRQWGVSDEHLIDELRRLDDELGRTPTYDHMQEYGEHSPTVYTQRFGSWNDTLRTAGLEPVKVQNIPREALIGEVQRLADELGRVPTAADMRFYGKYTRTTYQRQFGSWNNVIKAAGYEPNVVSDIPIDDLLGEIRRLKSDLGRIPRVEDIDRHGRYSRRPYGRHFSSWYDVIETAGFDPRTHEDWVLTGEDHPLWKGGTFPYGSGWTDTKKEQVRERDGRECQHCGRGEEEHMELTGMKHSVHHIQKARAVDDPSQRNSMENLVTLCRIAPQNGDKPCHDMWEEMSPLRPDTI